MLIFAENQPLAKRIIVEVLLGELKFQIEGFSNF